MLRAAAATLSRTGSVVTPNNDGSHTITDLADVVTGYLRSITNDVEENYSEVQAFTSSGAGSGTCSVDGMCPCTTCSLNAAWGQSIDQTITTAGVRAGVDVSSSAAGK